MLSDLKWSMFASVGRYILQTAAIIVLARLIQPESFGVFSAVLALTTVVFFFCQAGTLNLIITCKNDELEDTFFQAAIISLSLSLISLLMFFIFSDSLLNFLGLNNSNKLVLLLLGFNIVIKVMYIPLEALQVRNKKFRSIAWVELFTFGVGYFLVGTTTGFLGFEEFSLVYAVLFQSLISLAAYGYVVSTQYHLKFASISGIYGLFKKSIAFSYFQVSSSISGQVDNIFVSKYMGIELLGYYSRAYQLMVVPCNFFGLVVGRVFLTNFKDIDKVNSITLRKRIGLSLLFSTLSSFILIIFLYFFGEVFVSFLLGNKWGGVYIPLFGLCLSVFPRLVYKINEPILLSNGKEKVAGVTSTFYFLLLLGTLFWLKGTGIWMLCMGIVFCTYIYSIISSIFICILRKELTFIYFFAFLINIIFLWVVI